MEVLVYFGIFIFSITGALKARTHNMDIFGASVLAFATAFGGGTLRDILLGRTPISWLSDRYSIGLVLLALIICFLFKSNIVKFNKIIFATDAMGLGLFTLIGIKISMQVGEGMLGSIIMGVITATFGGLITDLLCNRIPEIFKKGELYATASLFGGLLYMLLFKLEFSTNICVSSSIIFIVFLRYLAKIFKIQLPFF